MKKPRKPFKKVIIKSRKITEPTVIPATVEIKPCAPAYADGLEPSRTAKNTRSFWDKKNREYNNSEGWRV